MKVIIYGAGRNCIKVMRNLERNGETLLCIADKNWNKIKSEWGYQIIAPDQIKNYDYELIVVSVENSFSEIQQELLDLGVEGAKIKYYKDCLKISPKHIGTMIADWEKEVTVKEFHSELCSHADGLSNLEREFLLGEHNRSWKLLHYFEVYNRHMSRVADKDHVTIMEIGVQGGGSLQVWKKVFGPKAKIIGVDIDPSCKQYEDDQITIFIGDQEDRDFWGTVKKSIPSVDILVDDGGHYMGQQIVTFEEMFPHLTENGIYICEDTATSYAPKEYGSGYRKNHTFIEYSKNFVDYLHAWLSKDSALEVNEYTKSMHSVHYYPGMVVVEKKKMYPPVCLGITNTKDVKHTEYTIYYEV